LTLIYIVHFIISHCANIAEILLLIRNLIKQTIVTIINYCLLIQILYKVILRA